MMWLQFLGGAGTVTGSRLLIEHLGSRVLIDCGMFQGERELRRRNWEPFGVDPTTISSVVLSHAHLDHSGWLPRLVNEGFSGPIYSSGYTTKLAALVLRDAAHLQEEDAQYAARKGFSRHHPPLPLYDEAAAEKAIALLRPVGFGELVEAAPGTIVRLHRAGHILGSATVELRAGGDILAVSGDLGRPDHPLLLPPDPVPAGVGTVVVESTYGDRSHPPRDLSALAAAIRDTVRRGGVVLIPAFAVDRTEIVLMAVRQLMADGQIPELPVWLDSPMAAAALRIYRDAIASGSNEVRPVFPPDPFGLDTLRVANSVAESMTLNAPDHPCIIVSASGMATGGRVVHHLAGLAPDPRNLIVLAGFQVPGTRGYDLLQGAKVFKAHGRYVPVRAQVLGMAEFSCHADRNQILDWLRTAHQAPRVCFTVHGEPAAARSLATGIHDELGWCAVAARPGERVRT
jgi:metallo-beta-lactamase family protein